MKLDLFVYLLLFLPCFFFVLLTLYVHTLSLSWDTITSWIGWQLWNICFTDVDGIILNVVNTITSWIWHNQMSFIHVCVFTWATRRVPRAELDRLTISGTWYISRFLLSVKFVLLFFMFCFVVVFLLFSLFCLGTISLLSTYSPTTITISFVLVILFISMYQWLRFT